MGTCTESDRLPFFSIETVLIYTTHLCDKELQYVVLWWNRVTSSLSRRGVPYIGTSMIAKNWEPVTFLAEDPSKCIFKISFQADAYSVSNWHEVLLDIELAWYDIITTPSPQHLTVCKVNEKTIMKKITWWSSRNRIEESLYISIA